MLNEKIKAILGILFLPFILFNCSPTYLPNVISTPSLSEKNDIHIGGYLGLSGLDGQLAFAATDNIGLMVNGSYIGKNNNSDDNYQEHKFIEFGTGYFTEVNSSLNFEVYGGYGFGNLKSASSGDGFFLPPYTSNSVKLKRFFIQPSFLSVRKDKLFSISLSSRFSFLKAKQDLTKYFWYSTFSEEINLTENYSKFFIEPVLTSKIGNENIKGVIQIGFSFLLNNKEFDDFSYQPLIMSYGVNINLNNVFGN
ncbi:MAG: hypothetical protein DWQ06_10680 [Calditrichaeota bacterium]|nr:MAG: hypothetical protein DWQ06_10680 [Calditrichota bacterium]